MNSRRSSNSNSTRRSSDSNSTRRSSDSNSTRRSSDSNSTRSGRSGKNGKDNTFHDIVRKEFLDHLRAIEKELNLTFSNIEGVARMNDKLLIYTKLKGDLIFKIEKSLQDRLKELKKYKLDDTTQLRLAHNEANILLEDIHRTLGDVMLYLTGKKDTSQLYVLPEDFSRRQTRK